MVRVGSGGVPPPPEASEFIKILLEKSMEICYFDYFNGNFADFKIFSDFIGFFAKIWAKTLKNEKCACLWGSSNFLNISVENQWKPVIFDNFNGNFAIFQNFSQKNGFFGQEKC